MANQRNILISGGTGLIGTRLTALLKQKGYSVSHLSRRAPRTPNDIRTFFWDPYRKEIESGALASADTIIHLAGAGIADKRWNASRKQEILLSRTLSTRFLCERLLEEKHPVEAFISASGISYYGLEDGGKTFVESDPPAKDFMARVTYAWEREVDEIRSQGLRVVGIRTGVVLSPEGGALRKLVTPVKFFVGAPLGSGRQFVNWVHMDDLCNIYIKAVEDNSMAGVYNGVAPNPVTNRALTEEIAKVLKRPLWLPPVPGVVVKLIAGEVADLVLNGGKVSSEKIHNAGFRFQFPTLESALKDCLTNMTRKTSADPIPP